MVRSSEGTNIRYAYNDSLCKYLHATSSFVCDSGSINITHDIGHQLGVTIQDNDRISISGGDIVELSTNTEADGINPTTSFQPLELINCPQHP
jgi:hypothetical protein